jgi:hypothetical protein
MAQRNMSVCSSAGAEEVWVSRRDTDLTLTGIQMLKPPCIHFSGGSTAQQWPQMMLDELRDCVSAAPEFIAKGYSGVVVGCFADDVAIFLERRLQCNLVAGAEEDRSRHGRRAEGRLTAVAMAGFAARED